MSNLEAMRDSTSALAKACVSAEIHPEPLWRHSSGIVAGISDETFRLPEHEQVAPHVEACAVT